MGPQTCGGTQRAGHAELKRAAGKQKGSFLCCVPAVALAPKWFLHGVKLRTRPLDFSLGMEKLGLG